LLVQAEDVAGGVAEARGDLGRIHADRLHDLAAVRGDRFAFIGAIVLLFIARLFTGRGRGRRMWS